LSRDKVLVLFPVLTVLRFGAVDERVEGVFPKWIPCSGVCGRWLVGR